MRRERLAGPAVALRARCSNLDPVDSVEPGTQPPPRPRPAKRTAAKRAAPAAADPRVSAGTPPTGRTRRANGAPRPTPRPDADVVHADSDVELPSPTLPEIVPAETRGEAEPDVGPAYDDHPTDVGAGPAFPVEAPLEPELLPEPEPEPIVTFVDPSTMQAVQPIAAPRARAAGRSSRPRVRRVTRVVRHVDTWSVFKVALVFNLLLYFVCLTSGVLLWRVATATGTVDNAERFFEQFGWSSFTFHGGVMYHAAWIAGLFAVVGLTGFAVLLATLFNLITDLVGGIRVSVLEEEVVARSWSVGSVLQRDDLEPSPPSGADDALPGKLPLHPY